MAQKTRIYSSRIPGYIVYERDVSLQTEHDGIWEYTTRKRMFVGFGVWREWRRQMR